MKKVLFVGGMIGSLAIGFVIGVGLVKMNEMNQELAKDQEFENQIDPKTKKILDTYNTSTNKIKGLIQDLKDKINKEEKDNGSSEQ